MRANPQAARRSGPARLFALALLVAAAPAAAEPARRAPTDVRSQMERSFARFSREWMQELKAREQRERARPSVRPGPDAPLITYRGYAEEFEIELRPTGRPAAPYVGLLHYTENLYSCTDMAAAHCRISASTPVTEVFRFVDGSWIY